MKKILIISLLILLKNNYAQEIRIGFRAEIFAPLYDKTEIGKTFAPNPIPPNVYFVLAIKPANIFQLDLRSGISFVENYGGFEFGGYLKYFPNESIYLLAAYNLHFMGGEAHGTHSNNETTFTICGFGVGFVTGKYSSIEFLLFFPSPKEWQYDVEVEIGGYKSITTKFIAILKIGFGFDWPI